MFSVEQAVFTLASQPLRSAARSVKFFRNVAIVSYNSQKVVNTTSDGVIELKLRPGAKLVVTYLISNK